MPEVLEVEIYRRGAESILGVPIAGVDADDAWYLKGGLDRVTLQRALRGRSFTRARRRGKLLLLDTDGPTLGLRFGMTGRLVVDAVPAVERLEYGSNQLAFERLRVRFAAGRWLSIDDPRRLGGVELDPDEDALGPDVLRITPTQLRTAMTGARGPIKARLLDQSRIAGLGNLLVDESLWRARIDPAADTGDLSDGQIVALHRAIRETVRALGRRGGSHTGDLHPARVRGGQCPRCSSVIERRTIGGRTTFSCPSCQR